MNDNEYAYTEYYIPHIEIFQFILLFYNKQSYVK